MYEGHTINPLIHPYTKWQLKQNHHKLKHLQQNLEKKDPECIAKNPSQKIKIVKTIKNPIKDKVNKLKTKVMSKNSTMQNYECVKTFIQTMESRRKRTQKPVKKEKFEKNFKYHPALEYND